MEIRNIAIIAHVDHGKTTITDALMRQTGMTLEGVTMDSNALERERGITIYSKNASIFYKGTKINLVDTPGHADFGSEVERVLRSIDCVLLVVDAQEGPMPQTRFVLKKSLELGIRPIVVLNKMDKPAADAERSKELVYELFLELGATDAQLEFPVVYAVGRKGIAKLHPTDESETLTPLLDTILSHVPPAPSDTKAPLRAQPFNLGYDNFLGRLAICRIYEGELYTGEPVVVKNPHTGVTRTGKLTKLFTFEGIERKEVEKAPAGDIVLAAGLPDIDIGETLCAGPDQDALPAIAIDEPTIALEFRINDSPLAGRDGKFVTSRQIRERLERELEVNVGLRIEFSANDAFKVYGRGELHIGILLENMRREGYELQVSQPQVILKHEGGKVLEPYEEAVIDVPEPMSGSIIQTLGARRGILMHMNREHDRLRLTFEIPTRGLLGYRNQFLIETRGEGILCSRFIGFRPHAGDIERRTVGSMVSMASGTALAFSLWNLQERGMLYIGPGTEVYEGMVIGNAAKGHDMEANPVKGKHLTNVRSSRNDDAIQLEPPFTLTIERGLEVMAEDEYLEVTPAHVRLRKRYLTRNDRTRAERAERDAA